MSIKQDLDKLGIDTSKINSQGHTLCPKCSHERKKKNDPCLSVNINTGEYHCWNDSCDFKGGVGGEKFIPIAKEYTRPKFVNTTQVSKFWVDWFFKERGIGQITLNKAKLTESKGFDGRPLVNFNYFRNYELINVKYRDIDKKFRLEKNAELIFYNIDAIKDSTWCIITEGEIDALSYIEVGIQEVISVPNGASITNNSSLEYLDNCIEYFNNKTKIILATDSDTAGSTLRDELARRLGKERCFKIDLFGKKDANEVLKELGVEKLKSTIKDKNLISFPIDGVITADMIWEDMEDMFVNGLSRGATTDKLEDFDKLLSFIQGQLGIITGIPNHGKSPFALMVMTCLSLKYGWKWAMFSPEHKPLKIFIAKMCELLLGKRMRKGVGFSEREKSLARDFITKHFFFIEPEDDQCNLSNILAKSKQLVVQRGIKGLLIDPWNKLEHNIEKGDTGTTYISKELDKVIKFNQKNEVMTIIVAHPTKVKKVFKSHLHEVPTLYDISDSSNWFNKPDWGVTFYRNFDSKMSEVYVQKCKYEHLGEQGKCELRYNMNNGRFTNKFGEYDNTNWLMPREEQVKIEVPELKVREPLTPPKQKEEQYEEIKDEEIPF